VKARSSVFRYKGKEIDPKKIASELNVQAILNGRVVQRGEQLIYPEAIAALEKARLIDVNPSILGYLGYAYAAAGKKAEAQKVLEELKELSKQRYVSAYNIACVYAGLNDKDQAFKWLERAYQERSLCWLFVKVSG
ncbi:MAG: hypothetical protein M3R15_08120, partial [Acidobacteriota bacterium]|nr:hypothetical protein [Acidobacteriota bacterium]